MPGKICTKIHESSNIYFKLPMMKSSIKIYLVLVSIVLLSACSSSDLRADLFTSGNYLQSPAQVAELLGNKKTAVELHVLDVRTPAEFQASCLPGAKNVDFKSATFEQQIENLDKNAAYLLYCRTGIRSAAADAIMKKAGFSRIMELKGGITAWQAAGEGVDMDCK
jgi:rhodanese-related sulfurtransferase